MSLRSNQEAEKEEEEEQETNSVGVPSITTEEVDMKDNVECKFFSCSRSSFHIPPSFYQL